MLLLIFFLPFSYGTFDQTLAHKVLLSQFFASQLKKRTNVVEIWLYFNPSHKPFPNITKHLGA